MSILPFNGHFYGVGVNMGLITNSYNMTIDIIPTCVMTRQRECGTIAYDTPTPSSGRVISLSCCAVSCRLALPFLSFVFV